MIEIFLKTFIFYFIVIDPIGSAPIFLVVTEHLSIKEKIKTALHGTFIATLILLFFGLLGNSILAYLKISFPAFTIAGGIILFVIALEMLFGKRHQRKEENVDFTSDKLSIFPLATPLLAGPAAITSVIVSVSSTGPDFTKQSVGMAALISATIATFIILFIAAKSEKIINKKIISVISRIVAIILAGLSIQYILDGIKAFVNF
ncbi:MarC family protein [Pelagibacteraceae bacterium]|jgi:multiple antibiotic resistance protein|nr:MarC family protein [Pelagibacteraceae bacterium]